MRKASERRSLETRFYDRNNIRWNKTAVLFFFSLDQAKNILFSSTIIDKIAKAQAHTKHLWKIEVPQWRTSMLVCMDIYITLSVIHTCDRLWLIIPEQIDKGTFQEKRKYPRSNILWNRDDVSDRLADATGPL